MKFLNKAAKENVENFETYLIRIIVIILILLIASATTLYYMNLKNTYTLQMKKNNDSLTEQIGISYETMMRNITDSVYKVPLYDDELINLVRNYGTDSLYRINLFKSLSSVVLGNQYLLSAYLYDPKHDIVYNSDTGTMSKLNNFFDENAFKGKEMGRIYTITDPRLVQTSIGKRLLMSVIMPVPLSTESPNALLVVNIDASKLYTDILKRINSQDNVELYVYNNDKTILISKKESLLFTSFDQNLLKNNKMNGSITSYYYSDTLKWNFVLETTIQNSKINIANFYWFTICLMLIFLLGLMTIILLIRHYTKPMRKIISNYNDNVWREYLTGSSFDLTDIQTQLSFDDKNMSQCCCAVLILQYIKSDKKYFDKYGLENSLKDILRREPIEYKAKLVVIEQSLMALVINLKESGSPENCREKFLVIGDNLLNSFDKEVREHIYIGISLCKDSFSLIPICYREALEALNYKINSNSNIINYENVINGSKNYQYPYDIEKQLVNNILTGNIAIIEEYINRFFSILGKDFCIQDSEVRNIVYQLELAIIRATSNLDVPVKINFNFNVPDLIKLDSIKKKLISFIKEIVAEINNRNGQNYDISKVLNHIEKRFAYEDFNLNIGANELNINRNYLARIVREQTGETFNDYISRKRINAAKELITNTKFTIEEIGHKVGFNYSHYFIKVFKNIEGITPGRYRDQYSCKMK